MSGTDPDNQSFTHNPTMADSAALDAIAALLSGNEWNADTFNEVAEIVRETGRAVDDTEEG